MDEDITILYNMYDAPTYNYKIVSELNIKVVNCLHHLSLKFVSENYYQHL